MTSRIEQQPDDDVAYGNRGQLYARLAQWDRAAEDFARARSNAPDDGWWCVGDGFAALKIGDEQRYRGDCQRLLALARNSSQGDGLRGVCVWMFNTRFRPLEDIPEIREFLQERLDELESDPAGPHLGRFIRIRLGLPTPELDEPVSSDDTVVAADVQLREALRAIQLGRVQEARDLHRRASEIIRKLRINDTEKGFWLRIRCEFLAEEVGELLSQPKE